MSHLAVTKEDPAQVARYASGVYVVVCRGPNCRARGAMPLRKQLVKLLAHDPDVQLVGYSCFGQCDYGPNVAFYPPGEWFGALSQPNDAERVVCHARGTHRLEQEPLRLPEAERAEHLRNIAELVRTLQRDRGRPRRWWWPFG
jgi:(2Fe-2S) ferredoxin